MVDHGARGVFTRPTLVIGAVALGAVTAGIGVVPAASAAPVDQPGYPSWQDVQRSKHDTKAAEAEVKTIVGLIGTLQTAADKAERKAQLAAEKAHEADAARDTAAHRLAGPKAQAAAAEKKARVSRMRAGLLAAHLAHQGGQQGLRQRGVGRGHLEVGHVDLGQQARHGPGGAGGARFCRRRNFCGPGSCWQRIHLPETNEAKHYANAADTTRNPGGRRPGLSERGRRVREEPRGPRPGPARSSGP